MKYETFKEFMEHVQGVKRFVDDDGLKSELRANHLHSFYRVMLNLVEDGIQKEGKDYVDPRWLVEFQGEIQHLVAFVVLYQQYVMYNMEDQVKTIKRITGEPTT